ncbi:metalloendopeptidases [Striga asiatica]|uniref:Metalloendopeptidases n=1 Tax=Striga asiatica TaxID=4170 RepID=A0A5A7QN90_STRAF|nr:metalloendopeptidases [Striga asiatica]
MINGMKSVKLKLNMQVAGDEMTREIRLKNNNQKGTVRASFMVIGALAAAMAEDGSEPRDQESGSIKSREQIDGVRASTPEIWSSEEKPSNPPATKIDRKRDLEEDVV